MRRRVVGQSASTTACAAAPAAAGTGGPAATRGYLDLLHHLDAGAHVQTRDALQERIDLLRAELSRLAERPLGLLAPCYLGEDFEVHLLDLSGESILAHFRRREPLPPAFEAARALAASRRYEAIEIYPNHYRCIREDGSTLKVDRPSSPGDPK